MKTTGFVSGQFWLLTCVITFNTSLAQKSFLLMNLGQCNLELNLRSTLNATYNHSLFQCFSLLWRCFHIQHCIAPAIFKSSPKVQSSHKGGNFGPQTFPTKKVYLSYHCIRGKNLLDSVESHIRDPIEILNLN